MCARTAQETTVHNDKVDRFPLDHFPGLQPVVVTGSILPEIVRRSTRMPVLEIVDGMPLAALATGVVDHQLPPKRCRPACLPAPAAFFGAV